MKNIFIPVSIFLLSFVASAYEVEMKVSDPKAAMENYVTYNSLSGDITFKPAHGAPTLIPCEFKSGIPAQKIYAENDVNDPSHIVVMAYDGQTCFFETNSLSILAHGTIENHGYRTEGIKWFTIVPIGNGYISMVVEDAGHVDSYFLGGNLNDNCQTIAMTLFENAILKGGSRNEAFQLAAAEIKKRLSPLNCGV